MAQRRSRDVAPVHFRMTSAGWIFLGVAVLVGLAAVKTQNRPLMFILFGGMFGAVHASAFLSRGMLWAVHVIQKCPSRVWQNQTVHVGYFLRNTRKRGAALALRLSQIAPQGVDSAFGYCAHLPSGGSFRAGARFVARLRGRFEFGGLTIASSFPFGLIDARRVFRRKDALVVWPARGRLTRQLLHRGAVEVSRAAPSRDSGGQDEFFGLREYREGDNPRWIHWRRSAGRAQPVLREMARPQPDILWLLLDTRLTEMSFAEVDRRERVLRFAATLVEYAFFRGYQVGMALAYSGGPRVFRPAGGRGQRHQLLDALADVDTHTSRPLGETLAALGPRDLTEAQVVAVTGDTQAGGGLTAVRFACRHLTVIPPGAVEQYFEDEPVEAAHGREVA